MTAQRILTCVFAAILLAEARRDVRNVHDSICDVTYNSTNKIQCYCIKDHATNDMVRSADCSLTKEIGPLDAKDKMWNAFEILNRAHKLTLTNAKGISLKLIPTQALLHTQALQKLEVRYGHVDTIDMFAFANLSSLQELVLSDNRIESLMVNAFANHVELTSINLDKNRIEEIKRDVFVNLPSLEKLFLTSNKIAIIHDRAFEHLENLKELELNINELISLNNESFYGLKNLQRLDLSSNSLEVVGDNTFIYLESLHTLNLEGNKIEMLDDLAFKGLHNLRHLSLAHNKIARIDNLMIFRGLNHLTSLSMRANEFKEFPTDIINPILKNFYDANANLDVEDNPFTCYCGLSWFASLINKTRSKNLKIAMDNIKCVPSAEVRDSWSKIEKEQSLRPVYDSPDVPQGQDYEYYDETQLNGKLFFTDIKELLNCTPGIITVQHDNQILLTGKQLNPTSTMQTASTRAQPTFTESSATSAISQPVSTDDDSSSDDMTESTSPITSASSKDKITQGTNEFIYLKTHRPSVTTVDDNAKEEKETNKTNLYTTSRLATVSAKPIEERPVTEDRMASDEAKPDKKIHRSIHQQYKSPDPYHGSSHRSLASVLHISMLLLFRLVY